MGRTEAKGVPPVQPVVPGEPASPEPVPRLPWLCPNCMKVLNGSFQRCEFVPKPPAHSPFGLAFSRKASAPAPPTPLLSSRSHPLQLPGPFGSPPPGCPAACHNRNGLVAAPTCNVCHADLELPVEQHDLRLKASPTTEPGYPKESGYSVHFQTWPRSVGRNAVLSSSRSRGLHNVCSFQPGTRPFSPRQPVQDPGLDPGPAQGAAQRPVQTTPLLQREGERLWRLPPRLGCVTMEASAGEEYTPERRIRRGWDSAWVNPCGPAHPGPPSAPLGGAGGRAVSAPGLSTHLARPPPVLAFLLPGTAPPAGPATFLKWSLGPASADYPAAPTPSPAR